MRVKDLVVFFLFFCTACAYAAFSATSILTAETYIGECASGTTITADHVCKKWSQFSCTYSGDLPGVMGKTTTNTIGRRRLSNQNNQNNQNQNQNNNNNNNNQNNNTNQNNNNNNQNNNNNNQNNNQGTPAPTSYSGDVGYDSTYGKCVADDGSYLWALTHGNFCTNYVGGQMDTTDGGKVITTVQGTNGNACVINNTTPQELLCCGYRKHTVIEKVLIWVGVAGGTVKIIAMIFGFF